MHGRKQELVRADREGLQRRRRVGPGVEPVAGEHLLRGVVDLEEPVVARPGALPPGPARGQRATQARVEAKQVTRPPGDLVLRAVGREQLSEHRQVVLGVVDGMVRLQRRGPGQSRLHPPERPPLHRAKVGNAAGARPLHIQRVEGRHARAGLADLQSRIREMDALGRGADGQAQQQLLPGVEVVPVGQAEPRRSGPRGVDCDPEVVEQQGILAPLVGKDPFRKAGNEHHRKAAAPHLLRAPDEDASETPRRGIGPQLRQTLVEHVAHVAERRRPHLRHRPQIAQHGQHAVGIRQHHRRQRFQVIEPFAPGRLGRKPRQPVDDREREAPEMLQVRAVAFEAGHARRVRIVGPQLRQLHAQLVRQPVQPPFPALPAADDRRFDQQPLPARRRAERPREDRLVIVVGPILPGSIPAGRGFREEVEQRGLRRTRGHLGGAVGRHPAAPIARRPAAGVEPGHLAEGEVLRETAGREMFRGAGKQRQEGATGGIGNAGAPGEPRPDAGAIERRFQQPGVHAGRPQQHRHPIEGHAAGRLCQDGACDLDRLAPLARRREEGEDRRVRGVAGGRRIVGREQEAPDAVQQVLGRLAHRSRGLYRPRQAPQRRERPIVALRHGRQRLSGPPGESRHDLERRLVGDGDVEQDEHTVERRARAASGALPHDPRRGATERRAVDEPGVVEKPRVAPREPRDIRAAPVELTGVIEVGIRVAQIAQGRRQRPAEGAELGDRLQVVEPLALRLLEGGVRRHRLHRQAARRSESAAGQVDGCKARRELPQAEPMEPERRAGFRGDIAREVVDRFPGLADEQHLTMTEAAPKRIGRDIDAGLRRRGSQNRDTRGRRQAVSIQKELEHGVSRGIAQRAPALVTEIVAPVQVDPPLARVTRAQRLAFAATAAQRLRPCRSSLRSLPLIDVCRHVQIHHPDHLPPIRATVRRVLDRIVLNLPRSRRGRPSGRDGAIGTTCGTGHRPRAHCPAERSAPPSAAPRRAARDRRAPFAVAA